MNRNWRGSIIDKRPFDKSKTLHQALEIINDVWQMVKLIGNLQLVPLQLAGSSERVKHACIDYVGR